MNVKTHNKDGPDFDIGFYKAIHLSNGTIGKPRDGTNRKPRDKTFVKPRDWIGRIPRDTLSKLGNRFEIMDFRAQLKLPGFIQIRGRSCFRRRKVPHGNRHFGPVMGEECPGGNKNTNQL